MGSQYQQPAAYGQGQQQQQPGRVQNVQNPGGSFPPGGVPGGYGGRGTWWLGVWVGWWGVGGEERAGVGERADRWIATVICGFLCSFAYWRVVLRCVL